MVPTGILYIRVVVSMTRTVTVIGADGISTFGIRAAWVSNGEEDMMPQMTVSLQRREL